MLIITKGLREHLVEKFAMAADATDEQARELTTTKMIAGEIEPALIRKFAETDPGNRVRELVQNEIKAANAPLESKMDNILALLGQGNAAGTDGAAAAGSKSIADLSLQTKGGTAAQAMAGGADTGLSADAGRIRVKAAVECYSTTTSAAMYGEHSNNQHLKKHFAGTRVRTGSAADPFARDLDLPSERTKALAGAWLKFMVNKSCSPHNLPRSCRMTEHDHALVQYALHECKFVGPVDYDEDSHEAGIWLKGQKMPEMFVKALLDDTTSGGLEAVPIEFDDAAIITPLLNGELFPLVTVRNVSRRRIEGFSVANPTISWGTSEGTDIPLFDTAGFIAAFDTNIYPLTGGIESGLDFEADSPVGIGGIIEQRYGEVFLKEMDRVIAVGSGTNQPLGVMDTVGLASPAQVTPNAAATVTDYETLMFAVAKEYRDPATRARQIFLANETTYRRSRSIAVGAGDQRRVFGMTHEDYSILGHPYKIVQAIANTEGGFFNMAYYRFYRRQGFQVRVVTEDAKLVRQNKRLVIVRSRAGGQMELSGAGALLDDMLA